MSKLFNRLNVVLLLVLLVATLFGFAMIPVDSNLPAHWNMQGVVDRVAPRNLVLIGVPMGAALVIALLLAVGQIIGSTRQLARGLSVALAVFAATQAMTVLVGLGYSIDVPRIVTIVSALGMIAVGNMLPKSGPDTHSQPKSSNIPRYRYRVEKFVGILFMLAGGVVFVAGLGAASSKWLAVLQIGSVLMVVTSGALYAYLLAKWNSA